MLTGTFARWTLLLGAALVLGLGSLLAGRMHGEFAPWLWTVLATCLLAGALVPLAAWAWRTRRPGKRWLLGLIVAGVLFRLAAVQASKELSDDAARYHWDGKVLVHGINPYRHAPESMELAHLVRHAIDERINHPELRTCYPPGAQFLFGCAYLLGPGSLRGFHLLTLIAELITWLLIANALARRRLPRAWLLLLVWSPLVIFEGYLPGHLDLLGLPFLALFVIDLGRGQPWRTGIWLGLACLIKPVPLLFLPAACRELGPGRSLRLLGALVATMVAGYLPFASAGWSLFNSSWRMATEWSFNASLGAVLEAGLPLRQAHLIAALLCAALVLLGTWRGRDLFARLLLAMIALVICTPNLFPWYLVWLLPLLALRPDPALLALVWLIPLVQEVGIGWKMREIWEPALWPRLVEYVPFYALLILGAWRRWGAFGVARRTPAG